MKFTPIGHVNRNLQVKEDNGEFRTSQFKVKDMPSVFHFRRNSKFEVNEFLYQSTVNWGNEEKIIDELGNKGSRSVMLAAIRILYYLGFRRVYLLGADFKMESGKDNYAFNQDRSIFSINSNNNTYNILNSRFNALKPIFDSLNYKIFNCNKDSGLKSFPFINYETAIKQASAKFNKKIDTLGWYDRKEKEKEKEKNNIKIEELIKNIDFGEEVE
jgi:hypothetical protein